MPAPPNIEFKGYALTEPAKWTDLNLIEYQPKKFQPEDVEIAITHCGVCGSDVHTLSQGWGDTKRPLVAGHEIVGVVTRVGEHAKEFAVGQRVGVGAQIGCCHECRQCRADHENYCPNKVATYNGVYPDGVVSQGGYSKAIRAHERFVFPIPEEISSAHAASMFCAGLTTYAPLKQYGAGPGTKVGVVGVGGLGHYAVLWAKALGAEVWAFTHDKSKVGDLKKMGADHVVNVTENQEFYKPLQSTLDIIISARDVAGQEFPLESYLSMLWVHGKFVHVGLPDSDDPLAPLHPMTLYQNACSITSSHIGNKKECLEMLELARVKGVKPWVEELPMSQVRKALEGVKDNSVRYRYVLYQDIP